MILRVPLCPAGHLPHKGGDRPSPPPSRTATVAGVSGAPKLPISPLVGEMSGRTEGG
ncbi:MAG: lytic murein transglycosylase, partial [Mesorhizobium sp.]